MTAEGPDNPRRRNDASRSEPSSALDASAAGGSARTTNELPGGSVPILAETRCLNRRDTRWRTTEFPTALLTTKPARAASAASDGSVVNAWTTRRRLPALAPRRITARKSSLRRNLAATGSTTSLDGGRIRRTVRRGPCDDEPPGWPGRRGSASEAGTRGPGRVGGCSAGRCAYPCSRLTSPVSSAAGDGSTRSWRVVLTHGSLWCLLPTCGLVTSSDDNVGTRNAPAVYGRPYESTHPPPGPGRHPLDHGPRPRVESDHRRREGTEWQHAVHREMLAREDALWHRAGLVSVPLPGFSPRWNGTGARVSSGRGGVPPAYVDPAGGVAAGRRTLVHSCGQLCGYLLCA